MKKDNNRAAVLEFLVLKSQQRAEFMLKNHRENRRRQHEESIVYFMLPLLEIVEVFEANRRPTV